MKRHLALALLALLCVLLSACTLRYKGTEYNAIRYRYAVWIWIDRPDGSYEQWMLNVVRGPHYQHYLNGRPVD